VGGNGTYSSDTVVNPGVGGAGTANSLTGTSVTYAGGGGAGGYYMNGEGSAYAGFTGSAGGAGGGGAMGVAGTVNTGGGGGGANGSNAAQSGGSGIVVIRYPSSYRLALATTGAPTYTLSGGYHIYKFTGTGSITF
jgi:hypothetical protein